MYFELRTGVHSEGGETYYPGDKIKTDNDLAKHNIPGAPPRYVPISEEAVASRPISEMTVGVDIAQEGTEGTAGLPALGTPYPETPQASRSEEVEEEFIDLDKLTKAELRTLADEEEIEYSSSDLKEELKNTIRQALELR
jgi:hypothetical protein